METGKRWLKSGFERFARREYALSVLLGMISLASLTPFLLLGAYALSQYAQNARSEELDHVASHAEDLAQAVDRELWGLIDSARILAGSRTLREGDLTAFDELARDAAINARGHYSLFDRSGRQLVSTRLLPDTPLPGAASPEELEIVFQTQRRLVGDLAMHEGELQFAVRIPVVVDGEVRYVLCYVPRSGVIYEVVLRQAYLARGWFAGVVDGNARLIARSDRHEEYFGRIAPSRIMDRVIGRSGLIEGIDNQGRDSVIAYHASDLSDWHAFVWVPKALLQAPANSFMSFVLLLGGATLAMSLVIGVLAGQIIRAPARRVLAAARNLGEGKPVRFEPSLMHEANVVGRALEEASHKIRFAMLELAHRSKNLLAVVQAMARQTGRTAGDVSEFEARLVERIASLARSHDLLVERSWRGLCVADLVAAQLAPFSEPAERRVSASGPPLRLTPEAAQSIGMALQELATNASKHGALSVPAGRIVVAWDRYAGSDGEARLRMSWQEENGPPVVRPARRGFGSTIVEQVVAASLSGRARLDWDPGGVVWVLDVPASSVEARHGDRRPVHG
ncbi:MAG: hypothetical protein KJZ80_00105 [Hyphomicrobiaceae bacterium]|nr:hypothetical protein [Hyphomicrobiaceae bacterium]